MNKGNCPLNGACCSDGVNYKAEVEDEGKANRAYIRCTEGTLKNDGVTTDIHLSYRAICIALISLITYGN